MPILASTVDEYFSDAMSVAANNATFPTTDDLLAMGSVLSDDIWNKFQLDATSEPVTFDMNVFLDEVAETDIANMLFNGMSSSGDSNCGNDSDSSQGNSWPFFNIEDLLEIRNHDCMWAGHCGSKEHPSDEQPLVRPIIAPIVAARQNIQQSLRVEGQMSPLIVPPQTTNPNNIRPQVQVSPGRSVLLKTVKQQQQQSNGIDGAATPNSGGFSPDTPPMSDDEEVKAKASPLHTMSATDSATSTLQILQSVIDDYDMKVDSDLCDYLEDDDDDLLKTADEMIKQQIDDNEETDDGLPDEEEEEEEAMAHEEKRNLMQRSNTVFNQFPSDHCYHKGTSLSYETPSDSDDEIDVVSISDPPAVPLSANNSPRYSRGRLSYHQMQQQQRHSSAPAHNNLPYNPSTRDRHQLQRTVATVMSNKQMVNNGQQYIRVEQSPTMSLSSNHPPYSRVKTLLPLQQRNAHTQGTQMPPARRNYNQQTCHSQPLQHGGKRKHPSTASNNKYSSSTSGVLKYTRKRANYHNSSDSEPEPSEKRSLHNNMERQRRIDLRNAFEHLRVMVPEVNKRERAAKVVILREARMYCNRLTGIDDEYQVQIDELKEHQERLRARVSQLRRSLANKHR